MKFKKLTTIEEIENLKKGDLVLVEFDKEQPYWNKEMQGVKAYNIAFVKKSHKELILKLKNNIYFNYEMYLGGRSVVKELFSICVEQVVEDKDGF
jgi:hypothetical protein